MCHRYLLYGELLTGYRYRVPCFIVPVTTLRAITVNRFFTVLPVPVPYYFNTHKSHSSKHVPVYDQHQQYYNTNVIKFHL
jgi:hypothetical protein